MFLDQNHVYAIIYYNTNNNPNSSYRFCFVTHLQLHVSLSKMIGSNFELQAENRCLQALPSRDQRIVILQERWLDRFTINEPGQMSCRL